MTFTTFWCGRCNRNKPIDQLVRRRRGSAICQSCETRRLAAVKQIRLSKRGTA